MSPKFYGFLWVLFFVSAGILWLGNVFTIIALLAYGFLAFGLVFTGMMCVLPGAVTHPATKKDKLKPQNVRRNSAATSHGKPIGRVRLPV